MDNIIFYSQANQDKWVCENFKYKTNGYFVDLGANDGKLISNTYTLEKYLGWKGLCIEANPETYKRLINNRKVDMVNCAIIDYNGTCFMINDSVNEHGSVEVPCYTLEKILDMYNAPKDIDYLSIDIEGCEIKVFENFDFSKWNIKLMTVEHNLYINNDSTEKNELFELLTNKGYTRVVDNAVCLERVCSVHMKPFEDWYVKTDLLNEFEYNKLTTQPMDNTLQ